LSGRRRAGLREIALSVVSLLVFVGILELILRLGDFSFYLYNPYEPAASTPPRRMSLKTGWKKSEGGIEHLLDSSIPGAWRLIPGKYVFPRVPRPRGLAPTWASTVSRRSFRGADFADTPGDDTLRIVCLGDSTTFGTGSNDDETYPAQLQNILRRRYPGRNVEVINAGIPGYSSWIAGGAAMR